MARVDICQNGTYYSLCDAGWSDEDARVFCRSQYSIEFSECLECAEIVEAAEPVE